MRASGLWLISIAFLISACAAPVNSVTPTPAGLRAATLTPAATRTSPPAPTDSPTPPPTSTPSATATLLPSSTPTLGSPITRTPAPAAVCPKADLRAAISQTFANFDEFKPGLLAYFEAGGTPARLVELLKTPTWKISGQTVQFRPRLTTLDVTGDRTPDALLEISYHFEQDNAYGSILYVFACQSGHYASLNEIGGGYDLYARRWEDLAPLLRFTRDLNLDGVPEIVYSYVDNCGAHANCTKWFAILEWDGAQLNNLIYSPNFYTSEVDRGVDVLNGDGTIRDTNRDGYLELVLSNGLTNYYPDVGPERVRTDTWAWNGSTFTLARWEHTPPVFRIHAVWDGDDAFRFGDDAKALAFYQQAIFDDKLLGWSSGQSWRPSSDVLFWQDYTPPPPDADERPRLSAYARYRIMLLHLAQGNLPEAKVVYDTLQSKFSAAGVAGSPYAALAAAFWDAYNASQSLATGCAKAREYAQAHAADILSPLGADVYYQNSYSADDICLFK